MVSIIIKKEDDRIVFYVEDDGKGFNLQEAFRKQTSKKGLGLAAMYQRTRMLGGKLDIRSQEGSGTRITFTIPLEEGVYRQ
jgi:signal transduction histidine kinase